MSDFTDARAAYLANADYAETASVTKAKAFITACRKLIALLPTETASAENRTRSDENLRQLREEIKGAQQWLATNAVSTGGGVVHTSFENFRDY